MKGAVNLSLRLGVPALIVSLTIVAFGTSAPELLISVQAVIDGVPGLALGNVVGSNTANILMVLGIPALLAVMHTSDCSTRKTYNQMIAASLLFIALAFRGVTDPKRFYKKHDALSPFAQIGTVVAGAFEGRGQTLRRKDRKTSLMGELLGDETKRAYAKRKFTQIQDKARGPGNARLKGKKKHANKKRG